MFDDAIKTSFLNVGKVEIFFYSKRCTGNPGDVIPTKYVKEYKSPDTDGDLTEHFKDTALAYFSSGGSVPSNKAVLDNLVDKFSKDYLDWRKIQFDIVFAGIIDFEPNGCIDTIEFQYSSDGARLTTRIYSDPFNLTSSKLGHFDYTNDCDLTADPCHLYYGPPAECEGSSLVMNKFKICIENDRIVSKFVGKETIS